MHRHSSLIPRGLFCALAATLGLSNVLAQPLLPQEERLLELSMEYFSAAKEAAELARREAAHVEVLAYAEQTRQAHEVLSLHVAQLRRDKGLPPIAATPRKQLRARIDLLGAFDRRHFDRRYMQQMGVDLHQVAGEVCRQGTQQARDPMLLSFAQACERSMAERVHAAQAIAQKLGQQTEKR